MTGQVYSFVFLLLFFRILLVQIAMKVSLLKMANQLRAHLQKKTKKRALYKANKPKVDPSVVAAKKLRADGKHRPQKGLRDTRGGQDRTQYGRDSWCVFSSKHLTPGWAYALPRVF